MRGSILLFLSQTQAAITCTNSNQITPYVFGNSASIMQARDLCVNSADKFALVGQVLDLTFTMGFPTAGLFAVVDGTSAMATEQVVGITDTAFVENRFNDIIKYCEAWPGSTTEWLLLSDEPLMFSKIDHVTLVEQSYYIASANAYTFTADRPSHYLDASGAIYLLTEDSGDTEANLVFKINAIGDATATMAEVSYTAGDQIDYFGLAMGTTDLALGVYYNGGANNHIGIITIDTTSLARTAKISSPSYTSLFMYHLEHFSGDVYVSNYRDNVSAAIGFIFYDFGAGSADIFEQTTYYLLGWSMAGVGIDGSSTVHQAFFS